MYFLTTANDEKLLELQALAQTRWWVPLQGGPMSGQVTITQSQMSEALWFAAWKSMKKLDIMNKALGSVRDLNQRQLMADKQIYKAQVLEELFDNLVNESIIQDDPATREKIRAVIERMKKDFPTRA